MKDRHRLRYRLRLGAETEINDHVELGFRFATGSGANSANQTLGSGRDFDPDGIFVDRAYVTLKPHGKQKPIFGDSFDLSFGKMPNAFKPKGIGPALLIWDGDQLPEGVALSWGATPCECWTTNLDLAYFVIGEVGNARDPGMIAVQLDNDFKVTDDVSFKSQISYYGLRKLDERFFFRSTGFEDIFNRTDLLPFGGNTAGLSSNNHVDLIEFHGGTTWTGVENWPITVWGNVIYNASADGIGEGKQNLGYGVGIEAGSKTAYAKIGVGYFEVEADAVPSVLFDSDLFDGFTNGEGFMVYVTRQIWKNTDFDVHAFFGDTLDSDVAKIQFVSPRDRVRIQTNIIVKF
ncbi:MAG: putative porin [Deltaproteobacteria bacterium]|nr:putative porin [Deltaproteobacteria bacterium]MBW2722794.1 putative porin [Deltaproteobacteria bacterium]